MPLNNTILAFGIIMMLEMNTITLFLPCFCWVLCADSKSLQSNKVLHFFFRLENSLKVFFNFFHNFYKRMMIPKMDVMTKREMVILVEMERKIAVMMRMTMTV